MTKQDPIDPASTDTRLELFHNLLEQAMEKAIAVQTKDDAKVVYSTAAILHILVAGHFPKISELFTNQYGELSIEILAQTI